MNGIDFQKIKPLVQPIRKFNEEFTFSSFSMKHRYYFFLKESDFSRR